MTKVTLANVPNLIDATTAQTTINNNSAAIVTAVENTLSRDGTSPNTMGAALDMNSNAIINLPAPVSGSSPLRLTDASTLNGGGTIPSLPAGGTTGQALKKASNTNYDFTYGNTVSSVDVVFPAGVSASGGPITGSGTITGTWASGTTGTGANVFGTSPTVATPTITNPTVSTGTFTSPALVTPALGTPTSGLLTNCTGLPISTGVNGLGTGVGTFLVTPSSANLASALTDETGTGVAVFGTSPTITTPNIIGTATNNNAAAGSVGEYLESDVLLGSAVSLTTGTPANMTSLSVTAGDWDIGGAVVFNPAGTTTMTQFVASSNTTSATFALSPNKGATFNFTLPFTTGQAQVFPIGTKRYSFASTTTVFFVVQAAFAVSTMSAYGTLWARRRR